MGPMRIGRPRKCLKQECRVYMCTGRCIRSKNHRGVCYCRFHVPRKNEGTDEGNGETPSSSNVGNTEPNGEVVSQHLKAELEEKEAELQRAKMDNSCLAADFQGLKAELEEKEAELQLAKMDNICQAVDFQARLTANSKPWRQSAFGDLEHWASRGCVREYD